MSTATRPEPHKKHHLYLFLATLVLRLILAALIPEPGYMDTAYYTAQGMRIAEGDGATEPFLWHYLDDPQGIPHSAFGYWMPLPSLLMTPFWLIGRSFFAAQIPFALLSALLVVLGARIAYAATKRTRHYWAVGGLLAFSAYFFPFWTLPETFAPFALCGALSLWAAGRYWKSRQLRYIAIAAACAVLAYLSRSDGLLLVALMLGLPFLRRDGKGFAVALGVTLLCAAPWSAYNLSARGTLLPTGGTRTLWLTDYDDIFCYQCEFSLSNYLEWGWGAILESKIDALAWNLRTLLVVVGFIFLWPFAIVGGWRLRDKPSFVLAWLYLLLLFGAMTFGFSFPGPRGGFFHSSGALLPFIVTASFVGLDRTIVWIGGKRGWNIPQAQAAFSVGFVLIGLSMSLLATPPKLEAWRQAHTLYKNVGAWLRQNDPQSCPVLAGNPPGFWYINRIPTLMVPNNTPETVASVAERYGACWMVLDANLPQPLMQLYSTDQSADWTLVATWDEGKLYQMRSTETP